VIIQAVTRTDGIASGQLLNRRRGRNAVRTTAARNIRSLRATEGQTTVIAASRPARNPYDSHNPWCVSDRAAKVGVQTAMGLLSNLLPGTVLRRSGPSEEVTADRLTEAEDEPAAEAATTAGAVVAVAMLAEAATVAKPQFSSFEGFPQPLMTAISVMSGIFLRVELNCRYGSRTTFIRFGSCL